METSIIIQRLPYQAPYLEQQKLYTLTTGVSLPIGTTGMDNPLEMNDFMEGEQ